MYVCVEEGVQQKREAHVTPFSAFVYDSAKSLTFFSIFFMFFSVRLQKWSYACYAARVKVVTQKQLTWALLHHHHRSFSLALYSEHSHRKHRSDALLRDLSYRKTFSPGKMEKNKKWKKQNWKSLSRERAREVASMCVLVEKKRRRETPLSRVPHISLVWLHWTLNQLGTRLTTHRAERTTRSVCGNNTSHTHTQNIKRIHTNKVWRHHKKRPPSCIKCWKKSDFRVIQNK